MDIKKVGVLGCGLMGSGIAQVAATAGFDVVVLEQDQNFLTRALPALRNPCRAWSSAVRRKAA